MDKNRHLYWLLAAVGINRLCSLVPAYVYFDPFPFYNITDQAGNNIGITLQSYIYGISTHAIVLALFHLLFIFASPRYSQLFGIFFLLEVAAIFDYLLIFEHPIFHLWAYGVEFTDVKIILYTYFIIRWNQQT